MTDIIVYSLPHCPYCTMVKNFLQEKGINFIEKDVSEDREAAKEMVKKSGNLGVPQTEINGKIIVGFDRIALEEELKDIK
ncbi:glutaredoxin family protein [candidate division WOR-3 bacterium]|nr:glutaredoxin family protein [candidate division WOR-3 bacterium]